jgi:hypothetical protein
VWNATISAGEDGHPVIYTADESCTIPRIPATGTSLTEAFANAGVEGDSINEGYVAAIVMASKGGEPKDCEGTDSETALFIDKRIGGIERLVRAYGNYTNNAIKGVYNILNLPLGQNAASGMTTLANFFDNSKPSAPYSDGNDPDYPGFAINEAGGLKSLITAQLDPDAIDTEIFSGIPLTPEQKYLFSFYPPSLASANTPAYILLPNDGNEVLGTTAELALDQYKLGAAAVSYLFARTNVINMWTAFQGDWDTATDLVIQSYVKAYFVDNAEADVAARNPWRPGVPPASILSQRGNSTPTAPFQDLAPYSCDTFNAYLYDREENMEVAKVVPTFSPKPNANNELCFETNVITFNSSRALESPHSYNIVSESFGNGWIDVNLRSAGNRYFYNREARYYGLPVDSFAFTTRVKGGGLNEAIIVPSAYQRDVDPVTIHPIHAEDAN